MTTERALVWLKRMQATVCFTGDDVTITVSCAPDGKRDMNIVKLSRSGARREGVEIEHKGAWAQVTGRDLVGMTQAIRRQWLQAKGAIDGLAELSDGEDDGEEDAGA